MKRIGKITICVVLLVVGVFLAVPAVAQVEPLKCKIGSYQIPKLEIIEPVCDIKNAKDAYVKGQTSVERDISRTLRSKGILINGGTVTLGALLSYHAYFHLFWNYDGNRDWYESWDIVKHTTYTIRLTDAHLRIADAHGIEITKGPAYTMMLTNSDGRVYKESTDKIPYSPGSYDNKSTVEVRVVLEGNSKIEVTGGRTGVLSSGIPISVVSDKDCEIRSRYGYAIDPGFFNTLSIYNGPLRVVGGVRQGQLECNGLLLAVGSDGRSPLEVEPGSPNQRDKDGYPITFKASNKRWYYGNGEEATTVLVQRGATLTLNEAIGELEYTVYSKGEKGTSDVLWETNGLVRSGDRVVAKVKGKPAQRTVYEASSQYKKSYQALLVYRPMPEFPEGTTVGGAGQLEINLGTVPFGNLSGSISLNVSRLSPVEVWVNNYGFDNRYVLEQQNGRVKWIPEDKKLSLKPNVTGPIEVEWKYEGGSLEVEMLKGGRTPEVVLRRPLDELKFSSKGTNNLIVSKISSISSYEPDYVVAEAQQGNVIFSNIPGTPCWDFRKVQGYVVIQSFSGRSGLVKLRDNQHAILPQGVRFVYNEQAFYDANGELVTENLCIAESYCCKFSDRLIEQIPELAEYSDVYYIPGYSFNPMKRVEGIRPGVNFTDLTYSYTLDGETHKSKLREYINLPKADVTIDGVAEWEQTFTFHWNVSGWSDKTVKCFSSNGIEEPAVPARAGYRFKGWYTDPNFADGSRWYSWKIKDKLPTNEHLYAKWVRIYTVTFDQNYEGADPAENKVVEVEENAKVSKPQYGPWQTAHRFTGWYLDGEPYDFSLPVTGNLTLEARWVLEYYANGIYSFYLRQESETECWVRLIQNGIDTVTTAIVPETVEPTPGVMWTVTGIGEGGFRNAKMLDTVRIPVAVDSIQYGAFHGCKALKTVLFPPYVKSLSWTFADCDALTKVIISGRETKYGYDVFSSCPKLDNIEVSPENIYLSSIDGVLFNREATKLLYYPYGKRATSYVVPPSVTEFGEFVFSWNTTLESITMPAALEKMGRGVLTGCTALRSLTIPETLREIDMDCLGNNPSLETMYWLAADDLELNFMFYAGYAENAILYVKRGKKAIFEEKYWVQDAFKEVKEACLISFDSDGGTPVLAQLVVTGDLIKSPEPPTRKGFIFAGWTLNGDPVNVPEVKADGDMLFKAVWQVAPTPVESALLSEVRLFPNPFTTALELVGMENAARLEVYSSFGQRIYSQPLAGAPTLRVETSGWQPGLYLVRVVDSAGSSRVLRAVKL